MTCNELVVHHFNTSIDTIMFATSCFDSIYWSLTSYFVLIYRSPLYDEIISLCLDLGELDAAVAIVADLETTGITVPDETLDRVISARRTT